MHSVKKNDIWSEEEEEEEGLQDEEVLRAQGYSRRGQWYQEVCWMLPGELGNIIVSPTNEFVVWGWNWYDASNVEVWMGHPPPPQVYPRVDTGGRQGDISCARHETDCRLCGRVWNRRN